MVGARVGNYRIVRRLGEGGMGAVFEGIDDRIQRRAAIKVLHPGIASDPQVAARFFNEARSVNLIRHPGIVQVHELAQMPDGTTYIVMELLEGESLASRIQRQRSLSEAEAVRVGRQVASVLAAAHAAAIVHRDLKPDNVMIVQDPESPGGERAKVVDFGIAKVSEALGGGGAHRTHATALLGTPAFMAPEQCQGAASVDGQCDVYAHGVMMFMMLSGRLPFHAPVVVDLLHAHMHAPPPPLESMAPQVSPALAALVAAMLAKQPAHRPTMRQVEEALARLGTAPGIDRVASGATFSHAPTDVAGRTAPATTERISRRSGRWIAVLTAVLVLGGAGVAAMVLARDERPAAVAPAPIALVDASPPPAQPPPVQPPPVQPPPAQPPTAQPPTTQPPAARRKPRRKPSAEAATSTAPTGPDPDAPCPGPGQTRRCSGVCVAIDFDSNNCGGCGVRCNPGNHCDHLFCRTPSGDLQ